MDTWVISMHRRQFVSLSGAPASSQCFSLILGVSSPPCIPCHWQTQPFPPILCPVLCSCKNAYTVQLTHLHSIYLTSSTHQVLITARTGCSSAPPHKPAWRAIWQPGTSSSIFCLPLHTIRSLYFGYLWPGHDRGMECWNFQDDVNQSLWQQ